MIYTEIRIYYDFIINYNCINVYQICRFLLKGIVKYNSIHYFSLDYSLEMYSVSDNDPDRGPFLVYFKEILKYTRTGLLSMSLAGTM